MPWSSQAVIANVVIIQGDTGGVFIYDSSGNLVDSVAFQANVDPQTLSNLAGIANYAAGGGQVQLINATLQFPGAALISDPRVGAVVNTDQIVIASGKITGHNEATINLFGTTAAHGQIQALTSQLLLTPTGSAAVTNSLLEAVGVVAANSVDVAPAAVAPPAIGTGVEPWNYVGVGGNPAFGTGWSNFGGGFANLAFRFVAAPSRCVQIKGEVTHTATAVQTIFTLPAAYRPVSNQQFTCISNGSGIIGMEVSSAGLVELLVAPGAIVTHNVDLLVSLDI